LIAARLSVWLVCVLPYSRITKHAIRTERPSMRDSQDGIILPYPSDLVAAKKIATIAWVVAVARKEVGEGNCYDNCWGPRLSKIGRRQVTDLGQFRALAPVPSQYYIVVPATVGLLSSTSLRYEYACNIQAYRTYKVICCICSASRSWLYCGERYSLHLPCF
jgi:hypothetical protein